MEIWALLQRSGRGKGRVYKLAEGEYVMGRGAEANLRLTDTQASRRHASLLVQPEGVRLKDAGSANGVFVHGQRVATADLGVGDSFLIGQSLFLLFKPDENLAAGDELGVWRITALLDVDAVSWRYRAKQKVLEREVELEILRENFTGDAELLQHYRHILRGVAAANDPGVVPVFDLTEEGDRFLVARRFTTLRQIPWTTLNLRDRANRLTEFLSTMVRWYERGMAIPLGLNRITLNPDNAVVLLLPSAMDLYLVRKRLHTRVPQLLAYVSPEELAGGAPSPKAESYRLGVLLYHALTGRTPHQCRNRKELERALAEPAPNPRDVIPLLPVQAANLITRLLSHESASRPTVQESAELWPTITFPARLPKPVAADRRPRQNAIRGSRAPARAPAPARTPLPAAVRRRAPAPTTASPLLELGKTALFLGAQVGLFFLSSEIVYWLLSMRTTSVP